MILKSLSVAAFQIRRDVTSATSANGFQPSIAPGSVRVVSVHAGRAG
jgi:hypothetical protein